MKAEYHDDIEQFLDDEDRMELDKAREALKEKMKKEWVVAADEEGNVIQINPDGTTRIIRDNNGNIINELPETKEW